MTDPKPDDYGIERGASDGGGGRLDDDDPFADLDAEIDAKLAQSGMGPAAASGGVGGAAGGVAGAVEGPVEGPVGGPLGGLVGGKPPVIRPGAHVEPLPLEADSDTPGSPHRTGADDEDDEVPLSQRSVKELDTCPNCGGSMRGGDQIVCMRCGFDLNSMKVIATATGPAAAATKAKKRDAADDDEPAPREPLVTPGRGDFWLPAGVAAVSAIILLVGYLSGAVGLFPTLEATALAENKTLEITFMNRLEGLAQEAILIGIWWACGMGALIFLATVLGMRLGDGALASMRMLGVIVAMRVVSLVNFAGNAAEFVVEAALALAIFAGLSIALYRIKPRDAATLTVAGLGSYLLLYVAARLVVMAT